MLVTTRKNLFGRQFRRPNVLATSASLAAEVAINKGIGLVAAGHEAHRDCLHTYRHRAFRGGTGGMVVVVVGGAKAGDRGL